MHVWVLLQGVISGAINWEMLESQFRSDEFYKATLQKMVSIIEDVRAEVMFVIID